MHVLQWILLTSPIANTDHTQLLLDMSAQSANQDSPTLLLQELLLLPTLVPPQPLQTAQLLIVQVVTPLKYAITVQVDMSPLWPTHLVLSQA